MAEANADEAEFYLSKELAAKRNLSEDVWRPVFNDKTAAVKPQIITTFWRLNKHCQRDYPKALPNPNIKMSGTKSICPT
jgi:hypothetical protein